MTKPQGQAKHGVAEESISVHVLQDAYRDAIKRNDELAESLKRNSDILSETLGELRLIRHRFEREDREQTIRESRERQQKKLFGFRIHRG